MARIRSIKPEFFHHDGLGELSPLHRLLFIGLWTIADRQGRLEDRPVRIKTNLLPYDNGNVDKMLDDLANHREHFLVRYKADGRAYIQITRFAEHQRPHVNEIHSVIPELQKGTAKVVPEHNQGSLIMEAEAPTEAPTRREGKEPHVVRPKPSRRVPGDFSLTEDLKAFAMERGLEGRALDEEFGAFRDKEFPTAHSDWPATWRTWVRNWVKWHRDAGRNGASTAAGRKGATTAAEVTAVNVRELLEEVKRDTERSR